MTNDPGRIHPAHPGGVPITGRRDVLVIGAGQAGLAAAYNLVHAGLDVQVLERGETIGGSWSARWDSLRLFTPARYDALPGLPFPAPAWSYPGKDEVAAYLANYALRFGLPVRTGTEVAGLSGRSGAFVLRLAGGQTLQARNIVVATGAFGTPHTPDLSKGLHPETFQVHSHGYRSPGQVPSGPVLVIGGGNSGFQIARELAVAGRDVHLSVGTRLPSVPQRLAGRDLFWWFTTTGAVRAPASSLVGRRLRDRDPVIGTTRRALRRAGVTFRSRTIATERGRAVRFADGSRLEPRAVVWATGYRHDDRWITVPGVLDPAGVLINDDGATPEPGLHCIGRPWQHDRGSALLGYVGRDAHRIAGRIIHTHTVHTAHTTT